MGCQDPCTTFWYRCSFVVGVGNKYDAQLFQEITNYSALIGVNRGRGEHADNFELLTTSAFAGLVIDPLGISCTGGGNNKQNDPTDVLHGIVNPAA